MRAAMIFPKIYLLLTQSVLDAAASDGKTTSFVPICCFAPERIICMMSKAVNNLFLPFCVWLQQKSCLFYSNTFDTDLQPGSKQISNHVVCLHQKQILYFSTLLKAFMNVAQSFWENI